MPPGCVAVADAMGITDAEIFGDILCARIKQRGVAELITDGVVRDMAGVLKTGLSVWCQGAAAPPSVAVSHLRQLAGTNRLRRRERLSGRSCRGRRRRRRADPAALVDEVVRVAPEQERMETWIMDECRTERSCPAFIRRTKRTSSGTRIGLPAAEASVAARHEPRSRRGGEADRHGEPMRSPTGGHPGVTSSRGARG